MAGTDIWQTIVIKELRRAESKFKAGTSYVIRVVQKAKNGKHAAIKVQVGEEYVKAATGELAFKATDMSISDLKTIMPFLAELENLAKNPPPIAQPEPAAGSDNSLSF